MIAPELLTSDYHCTLPYLSQRATDGQAKPPGAARPQLGACLQARKSERRQSPDTARPGQGGGPVPRMRMVGLRFELMLVQGAQWVRFALAGRCRVVGEGTGGPGSRGSLMYHTVGRSQVTY